MASTALPPEATRAVDGRLPKPPRDEPAATASGDRIDVLDALRGFALFGILLANILSFSGWALMTPDQQLALAGEDAVAWQYRFHHLFVDGKFYTLFSLLFGVGFALQLARLDGRGVDGLRVYRRRVLVLLAIGLLHSFLIWDGDILTVYALLGLVLPFFRRLRDGTLLACAALLIWVVPFAGIALFDALDWAPHRSLYALSERIAVALGADPAPAKIVDWLRREDFHGWLAWIASGPVYSLGLRVESWRLPKVLGIMLVGLAIGRRLASGGLLDDRRRLKWVLAGGLAIGLPAALAYAFTPGLGQASWPSLVGTVPLAIAYGAAFVLAWPHAERVLRVFVAPGRMALTNYLSQSLIAIALFYGIGLGLVGHLPPWAIYVVAVGIFALQAWASAAWLARHEQGPAERAWRYFTYRGLSRRAGTAADAS